MTLTFNKTLLTATMLTLGGFVAMSANASGSATSDFVITTTIQSVCTIDASSAGITFTNVGAGTTDGTIANKKSAGDIKVKCSKDAPYVINLATTGNSASTTGQGLMTGILGDNITYQLHSDVAGANVWGKTGALGLGNEGNGVTGTGTGVSTVLTHSVYATITGSTDVKQDTYTDTITASVIY